MARPPLALGHHGTISTKREDGRWVARCRVRDLDGVTRRVARWGTTKAAQLLLPPAVLGALPVASLSGSPSPRYRRASDCGTVAMSGWWGTPHALSRIAIIHVLDAGVPLHEVQGFACCRHPMHLARTSDAAPNVLLEVRGTPVRIARLHDVAELRRWSRLCTPGSGGARARQSDDVLMQGESCLT